MSAVPARVLATLPGIDRAFVYHLPLVDRFRGLTSRSGVLLHGDAGWSEFSPFWDYGPEESAAWLRAAVEIAAEGVPDPVRETVPVNVTVPAVGPDRAHEIVSRSGCATAKVKVAEDGEPREAEIARLEAVRDAIGPGGRIRIDSNGRWELEEAEKALRLLDRAAGGLEYAEQPCRTLDDMAALRRRVAVPIAADELIRHAEDPYEVARAAGADLVVLKVQPLGGITRCLEIADQIGLPVVVSSALESSIGIRAGLALAAALPDLGHACGLGTVSLLADDVVPDPLTPVDGAIAVRPVAPDPGRLESWGADGELTGRWCERLTRVVGLL